MAIANTVVTVNTQYFALCALGPLREGKLFVISFVTIPYIPTIGNSIKHKVEIHVVST